MKNFKLLSLFLLIAAAEMHASAQAFNEQAYIQLIMESMALSTMLEREARDKNLADAAAAQLPEGDDTDLMGSAGDMGDIYQNAASAENDIIATNVNPMQQPVGYVEKGKDLAVKAGQAVVSAAQTFGNSFSQEALAKTQAQEDAREAAYDAQHGGWIAQTLSGPSKEIVALGEKNATEIINQKLVESQTKLNEINATGNPVDRQLAATNFAKINQLAIAQNDAARDANQAIKAIEIVASSTKYDDKTNLLLVKMIEDYINNFGQCYMAKRKIAVTANYASMPRESLHIRSKANATNYIDNKDALSESIERVISFDRERTLTSITVTMKDNTSKEASPYDIQLALK